MMSVLPRVGAAEEAGRPSGVPRRRGLALLARGLTGWRFVVLPPFLWSLVSVAAGGTRASKLGLALLYATAAASDFFDGRLARAAGAADRRWGFLDVIADVTFNCASLGCAAWLGRVGPWVPAGIALLAARYLWRASQRGADPVAPMLPRDRAGNLAGVVYYLLVGLVVCDLSFGVPGARAVAGCGDAVFAFTLLLLLRRPLCHGARRSTGAGRSRKSSA
jgi:phosphatidylglycerophosphate synthase